MKRCLYTDCPHNSRGTQCRCRIERKECTMIFPLHVSEEEKEFRKTMRDQMKDIGRSITMPSYLLRKKARRP